MNMFLFNAHLFDTCLIDHAHCGVVCAVATLTTLWMNFILFHSHFFNWCFIHHTNDTHAHLSLNTYLFNTCIIDHPHDGNNYLNLNECLSLLWSFSQELFGNNYLSQWTCSASMLICSPAVWLTTYMTVTIAYVWLNKFLFNTHLFNCCLIDHAHDGNNYLSLNEHDPLKWSFV